MGAWFALKSDRSKLNPCFGLRGKSGTVFQSHSKNNPCKAKGTRVVLEGLQAVSPNHSDNLLWVLGGVSGAWLAAIVVEVVRWGIQARQVGLRRKICSAIVNCAR
jgi:hypothetical protein